MAAAKKKIVKKKSAKKVTKSAVKKTVKKVVKKATKKAAKQATNKVVRNAATNKQATKQATKKTVARNSKIKVTREQRHKMICEAAYYISLGKSYKTVNPTEDWLQAEAAIDKICAVRTK